MVVELCSNGTVRVKRPVHRCTVVYCLYVCFVFFHRLWILNNRIIMSHCTNSASLGLSL
jgi:hypothetical protein